MSLKIQKTIMKAWKLKRIQGALNNIKINASTGTPAWFVRFLAKNSKQIESALSAEKTIREQMKDFEEELKARTVSRAELWKQFKHDIKLSEESFPADQFTAEMAVEYDHIEKSLKERYADLYATEDKTLKELHAFYNSDFEIELTLIPKSELKFNLDGTPSDLIAFGALLED